MHFLERFIKGEISPVAVENHPGTGPWTGGTAVR